VQIVPISDGVFAPAARLFFPELADEAWDAYRAEHLLDGVNLPLNFGCFLLRADGHTILVDTGVGPVAPAALTGGGHLMERLREIGVVADEIETVISTHMHPDHVGGNMIQEGEHWTAAFPRARYIAQAQEWEHWAEREGAAPLMERAVRPLVEAGRYELVEGEHELSASVRLLPTPGHTPGHNSVLISSGGEGAVILGDILHTPAQVVEPERSVRQDMDKDQARATRRAMWERVEQHGLTVCAGHLREGNNVGRIVRVEGKRYWQVA